MGRLAGQEVSILILVVIGPSSIAVALAAPESVGLPLEFGSDAPNFTVMTLEGETASSAGELPPCRIDVEHLATLRTGQSSDRLHHLSGF